MSNIICLTGEPLENQQFFYKCGDPGEIRTPDPVIRSHMLYPAELRGHLTTLEQSTISFSNFKIVYYKQFIVRLFCLIFFRKTNIKAPQQ